jgi:hypothetical protein
MPKGDATTNEIMEFLQEHMVTREEFNQLDGKVGGLEQKLNQTKLDILDSIDEKLGNLKGDLIILMRKEDKKVDHLIKLLQEKSILSEEDAVSLLEIRPFPQSVV